ncbi:UNVERIFIED_CONTAM: hypothetical protein GTU68_045054 [Idotea baltica]|nr:hypothetical protein [Idotea baltica]
MRGEIVALLGPNGAGKSTTFGMVCGLISRTEGHVVLNGHDVSRYPMHRRSLCGMGYLPQSPSIFSRLTVEQNLFAIIEYMPGTNGQHEDRVDELLKQFGLLDKRDQPSCLLSGGERRRLEIARCLVTEPAIILLDEPFTGIDPVTINTIQDVLFQLRNDGISILLTDHRERETLTLADRTNLIIDGQVLVSGDAATVLSNSLARDRYFGSQLDCDSILRERGDFVDAALSRDAA